jgi:hypothetical protein
MKAFLKVQVIFSIGQIVKKNLPKYSSKTKVIPPEKTSTTPSDSFFATTCSVCFGPVLHESFALSAILTKARKSGKTNIC